MKISKIGKLIIGIGVLSLFIREEGFYGFGGYVDNTWEILIVGLVIIAIGVALILIGKKSIKDE